jgi:hypothetical protein
MRFIIRAEDRNIGREDRLVRGAVALSLLLIGAFVVLASGGFRGISIVFGALLAYFLVSAALGWDPLYARSGIDTRTDAELAELVGDGHALDDFAIDEYVVDLREGSWPVRTPAPEAGAHPER